jgi:hypothetical protein
MEGARGKRRKLQALRLVGLCEAIRFPVAAYCVISQKTLRFEMTAINIGWIDWMEPKILEDSGAFFS